MLRPLRSHHSHHWRRTLWQLCAPVSSFKPRDLLRHLYASLFLRSVLDYLKSSSAASLYSWHSFRSGVATAFHTAGVQDGIIQLVCGWLRHAFPSAYRRCLDTHDYASYLRRASSTLLLWIKSYLLMCLRCLVTGRMRGSSGKCFRQPACAAFSVLPDPPLTARAPPVPPRVPCSVASRKQYISNCRTGHCAFRRGNPSSFRVGRPRGPVAAQRSSRRPFVFSSTTLSCLNLS